MARPVTTKPSDRGTNHPEADQRGTAEQLAGAAVEDDPAISWEREEQDRLPPRGAGSQHNQGEEKEPMAAEVRGTAGDDTGPFDTNGLQLGGTRGPSNQAR